MLIFLTRKRGSGLDSALEKQINQEKQYWYHVLQRVVAVICTLAERGLAFRGSNEVFGETNNGNFLGLIELIAKFDPFLKTHIENYGNKGRGTASYLSKTICEELILLMGETVRKSIINDVKEAGYFSMSVDSTPDCSHIDQLTVILRYVSCADGMPIERFLTFLQLESHTGENLANIVLDFLCNDCKLDFNKCRGQSYDNAANMSGRYKGMQQKILEKNPFAVYIPCAGHSLNLVGRAAVDCCLEAVKFFGIIEKLHAFFSASTHRWAVLLSFIGDKPVPKKLSDTRWEAHARATSAISSAYSEMIDALNSIWENGNEKGETRREAGNIRDKMEELEFVIMLEFWNDILNKFHVISKALQDEQLNLSKCAQLLDSLLNFLKDIREQFNSFEIRAKEKLPDVDYRLAEGRRRVRKKQVNDGNERDANVSIIDSFRVNTFIPIMDALETNLKRRAEVYENIAKRFSFLVNFENSAEEIDQNVRCLIEVYPDDIDLSLRDEIRQFQSYIKPKYPADEIRSHLDLYQIIVKNGISAAFPNLESILRLFLCLMITNGTGERSFPILNVLKMT